MQVGCNNFRPPSQIRSLLRDAARGFQQQMFFWGCDARTRPTSLLIRRGLMRLPRADRGVEGSSRYREPWAGGTIELHSFHVGWFPDTSTTQSGVVYIRSLGRFVNARSFLTRPGALATVEWESAPADHLLATLSPLACWVADYERWVLQIAGREYRGRCWREWARQGPAWLPPGPAGEWFNSLGRDPQTTARPEVSHQRRRLLNSQTT